ncbi:DUF3016 domain-containing protein [Methylomonas montana]|uniref:DUF3016 domain-containing protein n=1 Tax=Methylomonas montana TaxID=3058963 RepID=UPI00265B5938|nr:DUF3016 domain-containing protein [Methylomonas montana]WKJ92374.1 DUF3016 domain-containing protein [Methylomonas montana]
MSRFPAKLLLMLIAVLTGSPVSAEITVRFVPTDQYTDLAIGGSSTAAVQDDLLKQFEKHFKQLAERYLPGGDKLEIVVQDIDMAGATEPWRAPNLNDTRFLRDIYPPRISLHYLWYDKAGGLKADQQEKLSDLNYLMLLDSAYYTNNDPLRYEKALLDRWFRRTFSSPERPKK